MSIEKVRRVFIVVFATIVSTINVAQADDLRSYIHLYRLEVNYEIFATADEHLGIYDVIAGSDTLFKDRSGYNKTATDSIYWLKINFENANLSEADDWYLYLGSFDEIKLYYQKNDSVQFRKTGILHRNDYDLDIYFEEILFSPDELIDGKYLYARIRHVQQPQRLSTIPVNYSAKAAYDFYDDLYDWDGVSYFIPVFLFVGAIAIMMLYSFGVFFLYRDKIFFCYSIFLLFLLLYLGRKILFATTILNIPQADYIFNEVVQVVVNIAYLKFVLMFLHARKYYPVLWKVGRYIMVLLGIFIVVDLIILINDVFSPIQYYLMNAERLFMTFFAFLGIVHILINLKNKTGLYVVVGSVCFIGGSICTLICADFRYMLGGATMETFIFGLGLGYRFNQIHKEKNKIEEEINKVRITALRAQMKPHFIFNSLNSIRAYIVKNEIKQASHYLTRFSKLIRLILEYSSEDSISLEDEIAAIKLYVELEQMRFRESFGFNISISQEIDVVNTKIPPLILQPYIENAIWHGLTPKSGEKKLDLALEKKDASILCTIRDNGVGRSSPGTVSSHTFKKPRAMDLTGSRIHLMSKSSFKKNNIIITDLVSNGSPAGTEVKLTLPLIYECV